MTTNKTIREFAIKAKLISENKAEWLAIDTQGTVYAYKEKPVIKSEASTVWDISDLKHSCWWIGLTAAPDNFKNELYQISNIL